MARYKCIVCGDEGSTNRTTQLDVCITHSNSDQYENILLKDENNKLKSLLLLTDESVSDVEMNDLTMRQWEEFIKCFPKYKEG